MEPYNVSFKHRTDMELRNRADFGSLLLDLKFFDIYENCGTYTKYTCRIFPLKKITIENFLLFK